MTAPDEILEHCIQTLGRLESRIQAAETLCGILTEHVAMERAALRAAQASLAQLKACASAQPQAKAPAPEAWFAPALT